MVDKKKSFCCSHLSPADAQCSVFFLFAQDFADERFQFSPTNLRDLELCPLWRGCSGCWRGFLCFFQGWRRQKRRRRIERRRMFFLSLHVIIFLIFLLNFLDVDDFLLLFFLMRREQLIVARLRFRGILRWRTAGTSGGGVSSFFRRGWLLAATGFLRGSDGGTARTLNDLSIDGKDFRPK